MRKKDLNRLMAIRETLNDAAKFAGRADIGLVRKGGTPTTTLHCVRPLDGVVMYEIEKQIGSEFCLLWTALNQLSGMIDAELTASTAKVAA